MKIEEARLVLGDLAQSWPDQEVEKIVISLEFLAGAWLDMYEKSIFEGQTLKQLLTAREQKEVLWM